jgi:hypothetical protein
MSGQAIAAEVAAALAEASGAAGNGAQASLIRSATPPVNPWDAPSATTTTHAVWAIAELYRQETVDGTLIRAEDRRVMLEPVTPAPTTADRLSIGGIEYAIVAVQPEAPAGVALYYICQCRR